MEEEVEGRENLKSILPLLPLICRSNLTLFWPPQAVETLKSLSQGPNLSNVNSGDSLFAAISDIRSSLSPHQPLAPSARLGFSLFFDDLMSRAESAKWFEEVLPALANLLLRFPSLLEFHYQNADSLLRDGKIVCETGLRLLSAEEQGIVLLSQELISALLACAFFCLFPVTVRHEKHLPMINFNCLFESLYDCYSANQENKVRCIIHYFGRICSCMPRGFVSFERKVLPLQQRPLHVSYPKPDFWSKSEIPLCQFKVHTSDFIEDQSDEALEVDFANRYLGGGALGRGCVQEEIRFMINPELIAGMLFLPCMEDNEAIEIVGAERFSNYTGYASSFRFSGNHMDNRDFDCLRRRKTRIIAIDALSNARMRQYKLKCLLRETNKAFCGFLDQSKFDCYETLFQDHGNQGAQNEENHKESKLPSSLDEAPSNSGEIEMAEGESMRQQHEEKTGVATGNWGCGAFGGDPELKTIIQWLAASQALRPYILYYTFGIGVLQNLEQVSRWILSHGWTVGDLWNMLVAYASQRYSEETNVGFFTWLLPSLVRDDAACP